MPANFERYINQCADIEVVAALQIYGRPVLEASLDKLQALGDKVYAPGKWTVRDVLQHVIDAERIFAYRALRFARRDATILPPFDENEYAVTAGANQRSLHELTDEFFALRASTIALFQSFDTTMLQQEGQTSSGSISVLALGFAIAGHLLHHTAIFEERYYPLL